MMGFAKIAGGAPSAVRAMANHLMNATLRAEASRLAAYYGLGVVQPDQDVTLTKREVGNAQHVEDWLAGKMRPDLVRLAEYAMTEDARRADGGAAGASVARRLGVRRWGGPVAGGPGSARAARARAPPRPPARPGEGGGRGPARRSAGPVVGGSDGGGRAGGAAPRPQ